jgi:nucleoside-diphosphate-sugar epimerase
LPEGDTVSTAVIGATGRVGSEIVRGVLARGDAVTALLRDPGKARRAFGEHIGRTRCYRPLLFEHPAAELSVDDSAQLCEDRRQPGHIA